MYQSEIRSLVEEFVEEGLASKVYNKAFKKYAKSGNVLIQFCFYWDDLPIAFNTDNPDDGIIQGADNYLSNIVWIANKKLGDEPYYNHNFSVSESDVMGRGEVAITVIGGSTKAIKVMKKILRDDKISYIYNIAESH